MEYHLKGVEGCQNFAKGRSVVRLGLPAGSHQLLPLGARHLAAVHFGSQARRDGLQDGISLPLVVAQLHWIQMRIRIFLFFKWLHLKERK